MTWMLVIMGLNNLIQIPGYESQEACEIAGKASEKTRDLLPMCNETSWGWCRGKRLYMCVPQPEKNK